MVSRENVKPIKRGWRAPIEGRTSRGRHEKIKSLLKEPVGSQLKGEDEGVDIRCRDGLQVKLQSKTNIEKCNEEEQLEKHKNVNKPWTEKENGGDRDVERQNEGNCKKLRGTKGSAGSKNNTWRHK